MAWIGHPGSTPRPWYRAHRPRNLAKIAPPDQAEIGNAELKRRSGNPYSTGRPDDMQNCDLTAMEERLLKSAYADDDDWVDLRWAENESPGNDSRLTSQQKHVGEGRWWGWGGAPRAVSPTTQPYLENAALRSGDHGERGEDSESALQTLPAKGTSRQSEEAQPVLGGMEKN